MPGNGRGAEAAGAMGASGGGAAVDAACAEVLMRSLDGAGAMAGAGEATATGAAALANCATGKISPTCPLSRINPFAFSVPSAPQEGQLMGKGIRPLTGWTSNL